MKKFFQSYRRTANFIQWAMIGILFITIGILAYFLVNSNKIVWISILVPLGTLLILYSAITCYSRYGTKNQTVYYQKLGIPVKKEFNEIGGIIIGIYDEFRTGKGYLPITYANADGQQYALPSITFCKMVNEEELDMCDTRVATDMTLRKNKYIGVLLDFDFLESMLKDGYSGKIYISKYIYDNYRAGLDRIITNREQVHIYDRMPKLEKTEKKLK